jgi:hypothetical protein
LPVFPGPPSPGLRLGAAITLTAVNGRFRCAYPSAPWTLLTNAPPLAPRTALPALRSQSRLVPESRAQAWQRPLRESTDSTRSRGSYWRLLEEGEQHPIAFYRLRASPKTTPQATDASSRSTRRSVSALTSSGSSSTTRRDPVRRGSRASRPMRRSSGSEKYPSPLVRRPYVVWHDQLRSRDQRRPSRSNH